MAHVGRNIQLSLTEIEQAIKARAIEILRSRDLISDRVDAIDLINRMTVFWRGEDGQQLVKKIQDVMMTWED